MVEKSSEKAMKRPRQTVIQYNCDNRGCKGEMRVCAVALSPSGQVRHRCTVCHDEQWLTRTYPFVETSIVERNPALATSRRSA